MLKDLSQIECNVDGKICHFTCERDTPLSSVKEALFQFQAYIAKIEENIRLQQSQAEAEKGKEEPHSQS